MEAHETYVNSLDNENKEDTKTYQSSVKALRSTETSVRPETRKRVDAHYRIDKWKMKRFVSDLMGAMERNTKIICKC